MIEILDSNPRHEDRSKIQKNQRRQLTTDLPLLGNFDQGSRFS